MKAMCTNVTATCERLHRRELIPRIRALTYQITGMWIRVGTGDKNRKETEYKAIVDAYGNRCYILLTFKSSTATRHSPRERLVTNWNTSSHLTIHQCISSILCPLPYNFKHMLYLSDWKFLAVYSIYTRRMISAGTMQANIQLLLLALGTSVSLAAVGNTLAEKATGSLVVKAVVETIQQPCIFPDDALFLRRIAYAESRDGADASAFRDGSADYYGGIWRVDEDMFEATQADTTYHSDIRAALDIDWLAVTWKHLWKPLYSGLAARLYIASMVASVPRSEIDQAVTWVTEYRGSSVTTSLTDQFVIAAVNTDIGCSVPRADIIFVLDASSSIGANNYALVKDFVEVVAQTCDIGQSKVRIGLMTYSGDASVAFDLDEYSNVDDVITAVRAVPYTKGGTNTAAALIVMDDMFTRKGRGSDGVPQIGIFLTNGKSNDQDATNTAAEQVHRGQLTVFSVGITSKAYLPELQVIGTDPDCFHVYLIDSFINVIHFASQIQAETCKAPAKLVEDTPVTGELIVDEIYFYKMPVKMVDDGATVTVDAMTGMVNVYLSWSVRNPSSAAYDFHTVASGNTAVSVPWNDAFTDDVRELYGTLIGMAPTSKYTLSYTGSGSDRLAPASFILTTMVAVFMKALL